MFRHCYNLSALRRGFWCQVFQGQFNHLCVSGSVYAEYEEVIGRPRFRRSAEVIASTLRAIRENGFWVRPTETVLACSDPDDNIFLEYADAAGAAYLVTGNLKHFPEMWKRTRIVTARQLLDLIF